MLVLQVDFNICRELRIGYIKKSIDYIQLNNIEVYYYLTKSFIIQYIEFTLIVQIDFNIYKELRIGYIKTNYLNLLNGIN